MTASAMGRALLDLLFPPKCACCGRILDAGVPNPCPRCREALPALEDSRVLRRGPYGVCAAPFRYEGPIRDAVHALKFGGRRSAAQALAPFVVQAAAEHLSGQFDAVTFVPVSTRRLRRRGYDQARLLAQSMAARWGVAALPTLRKIRHTRAQSSLTEAARRRENVAGAYAALSREAVEGKRFLLVDDVVTTGSTLAAAAAALRAAGAASVVCAALAAAEGGGEFENKS